MQRRLVERLTVNGIPPVISRIDIAEESLNAVRLLYLPRIAAEPFIIQPNVGGDPVSITEEVAEVAMRLRFRRSSVIVGVFRRQPGNRVAGQMQVIPTPSSGILPERPVCFIRLQRKQIIEMRQMIGGIAERSLRDELDQPGLRVPHRMAFPVFSLVHTSAENDSGLLGIIEWRGPVTPAAGSEE